MKVVIFERHNYKDLETDVNRFITHLNFSEIFDIKYSGSGGSDSTYQTYRKPYYSAMIILK